MRQRAEALVAELSGEDSMTVWNFGGKKKSGSGRMLKKRIKAQSLYICVYVYVCVCRCEYRKSRNVARRNLFGLFPFEGEKKML